MSLRDAALAYGEFLLNRMRSLMLMRRWDLIDDTCERYERLMANLPAVPQPLAWDGDYN